MASTNAGGVTSRAPSPVADAEVESDDTSSSSSSSSPLSSSIGPIPGNSQIRAIPGYYYDRERSKYFKIEGAGNGSKAAYTSEVVKKRQAHDLQETKTFKKARAAVRSVTRAAIYDSDISRLSISRDTGILGGLEGRRRMLADGLAGGGQIAALNRNQNARGVEPIFCAKACFDQSRPVVDIHTGMCQSFRFRFDANGGTLLLSSQEYVVSNSWADSMTVSYNEGKELCASTEHPRGDVQQQLQIGVWGGIAQGVYASYLYPQRVRMAPIIHCSAAAPAGSQLLFAFGTAHGIMTLDESEKRDFVYAINSHGEKPFRYRSYSHLSFLDRPASNGQNLLSASHHGEVNLIDLRDPSKASNRAPFIHHPSEVSHIKQVHDHRILISGTESQLHQYDMRFLKVWNNSDRELRGRPQYKQLVTYPILTHSMYENREHAKHGLDFDIESGIVAVGQSSLYGHSPRIQLFSVATGDVLPSAIVNKLLSPSGGRWDRVRGRQLEKYEEQGFPPKCVKWVKESEGSMSSLYVSNPNGSISRYVWGKDKDDEK